MTPFQEHEDLLIGRVVEVSGTAIRVELDQRISELSRVVEGRVCPIGQLASIVKIHYGRRVLFAYVRLLRMRSEIAAAEGQAPISPGDDSRILEADLFAQGTWLPAQKQLRFGRGVETYPLPLQGVYLTTPEELEMIFTSAESSVEEETVSPLVSIGEYVGGNGAQCRANLDKLFGQHCAVLGSTGSGKSGTVAALMRSVIEHTAKDGTLLRPRIVIIDPHGEYGAALKDQATILRAYTAAAGDAAGTEPLRLPFWLMTGDELRSLIIGKTEAEATSQNNIVYKALKHARMVNAGVVQALPADPLGDQLPVLCAGKTAADISGFDRDKPARFSLDEFVKHIDKVQGRKPGKNESASATERKSHESILDKLNVLRTDPRIKFLMQEEAADSLDGAILQLTGQTGAGATVKIIDVSGAPNEVAGTLAAMICRLLFNYKVWQTRAERDCDPILLVCEEAHRYVPDRGEAQYREAQDAVRRIAKEGRKYGLGLMLVSQRPSDVESTVLSQCNSWIVLRLSNGADQEHVGRFLPDGLAGITRMLSSLSRREALFVGEAAALPARIRIRKLLPEQLPDSNDISFVHGWAQPALDAAAVAVVTTRWLNNAI
ncbi:ATP-binding protein [Polaromonas aquatica]|uniref:ATP-binding protein n=1 Tax=Polaromonas aquatica TaxID=332657 RepID=UPI003D64F54C